jgi:DeoR family transcriptional regulator of aga operon
MAAEERFGTLLDLIRQNGMAGLSELAAELGVSVNTVRRDLDKLQEQGLVQRIRGGAVYTKPPELELPIEVRLHEHADRKRLIAAAAAGLIREGEIILLDVGSTNLCLARQLGTLERITVVTNSLCVMSELHKHVGINLVALGGQLYHRESYFEPVLEQVLGQVRVDKLFLGISSVEAEYGLSEIYPAEVPLKRAFMQVSRKCIVLADGSKIGRASHFHVCPVAEADVLITDPSADPVELEKLEQAGLQVLVAGQNAGVPVTRDGPDNPA